jgi:hypothetical protein
MGKRIILIFISAVITKVVIAMDNDPEFVKLCERCERNLRVQWVLALIIAFGLAVWFWAIAVYVKRSIAYEAPVAAAVCDDSIRAAF